MTTLAVDLALRSYEGHWNRVRWEQLPDDGNRYEVIDGVLYMTTAPSSSHQRIILRVVRYLLQQIDDLDIGETLCSPIGVFMPGCDPVQPDILVVKKDDRDIIHERGVFGVPTLMVEVLSPSNASADTRIKRSAYARAGVPEYWIVRPTSRDVVVCSQPDTTLGDYLDSQLAASDATLVSPTLPVRALVSNFFVGVPESFPAEG